MKRLILASGILSLLIASLAVANSEQDDRGSAKNLDEDSSDSMVMKSTKAPTEESEFSAMESDKQTAGQSRESTDDDYDWIPSSWDLP